MAEEEVSKINWPFAIVASVLFHLAVFWFFYAILPSSTIPESNDESVASKEVATNNVESVATRDIPEQPVATRDTTSTPVATRDSSRQTSFSSRVVPTPSVASRETSAPSVVSREESEKPAIHVVKAGETLTKIAKQYDTTPEELARINGKPLKKMNLLWVGQKIKLRK